MQLLLQLCHLLLPVLQQQCFFCQLSLMLCQQLPQERQLMLLLLLLVVTCACACDCSRLSGRLLLLALLKGWQGRQQRC